MDKEKKIEYLLFSAWAVSVSALAGSLYFSEVLKYEPCELCWYQRILMYPLVLILGIAMVKKDAKQCVYVLPLAVIGGSISVYHYLIQKAAFFADSAPACGRVPCTGEYINLLGFITIPFLALLAFASIAILMINLYKLTKKEKTK
ncbi:disulfide oxidoreductase [Alkalihalobacillus macyae]|uniref:disulfide oxidoreductase n=1 Tax=Guptibacillus hwajinpoensis TaxID=208199 RepID=UPI00273BDD30|nr:disulfide oxidoreductase [Alkalihalobacillus macyae]MDP4553231.1 disulfide oxidoreductase [Alkalihalobacillus macyae]